VLRGKTRSFEREEGMGGGDAGDVVVEARPSSAFEMVEPEFAFHFLVVAFDAPPEFREVDQLLERGATRQVGVGHDDTPLHWVPTLFIMSAVGRTCATHARSVATLAEGLGVMKALLLLAVGLSQWWGGRSAPKPPERRELTSAPVSPD
jgi:hypothetical protein